MTTNNAVNVGLSGATGTGNFVGANTPTLITPNVGVATATSLVFNPTTSGIIGTTTNDNAAAGKVGEFVPSVIAAASAVSMTSGTPRDVTSISLTAGDWDIWGNLFCASTGGTGNITYAYGWSSTTSATLPDTSLYNGFNDNGIANYTSIGFSIPSQRYSLSGTSTIYLSAQTSGNSLTMCGGIYARRVR